MDTSETIRSFVRRQGKMTAAQQKAYENLKDLFCIPFCENHILNFMDIFPSAKKIILEIGFGMGTATAEIAEAHPGNGYLGIEVHTPGVGKLLWEIEHRGLKNIRIIHDDAVTVLREMIGADSFDGIHIFFPDPWQKKKHHKRRLIQPGFLEVLRSKMKAGAYIYLATDWEDYAEQMLQLLSNTEGLGNKYSGFAEALSWRPVSSFEKKGRQAHRKIFEIYFTKK